MLLWVSGLFHVHWFFPECLFTWAWWKSSLSQFKLFKLYANSLSLEPGIHQGLFSRENLKSISQSFRLITQLRIWRDAIETAVKMSQSWHRWFLKHRDKLPLRVTSLFFSCLLPLLPKGVAPICSYSSFLPSHRDTHTLKHRLLPCHLQLLSWSHLLSLEPSISGPHEDPDIPTASSYAPNGTDLRLIS